MTTPLPRGIERDETVHGKRYYTRAQLLAYGNQCFADGAACKPSAGSPYKGSEKPITVDDLMNIFGMKK